MASMMVAPRGVIFSALLLLVGCDRISRSDDPTAVARDGTTVAAGLAVIDHLVDGDTVDVVIDGQRERVRLTGIDTPEIAHAASGGRPGNAAECFGDEASAHIAELLPVGTEVRLVRDVVARDDYGRLLAYVYRHSDRLFVNEAMVRGGFAQPLTIAPNDAFVDAFVAAARSAESEDIGLWSACANG